MRKYFVCQSYSLGKYHSISYWYKDNFVWVWRFLHDPSVVKLSNPHTHPISIQCNWKPIFKNVRYSLWISKWHLKNMISNQQWSKSPPKPFGGFEVHKYQNLQTLKVEDIWTVHDCPCGRGNQRIQACLSSIQHKHMTPLEVCCWFISNDFKWTILESLKLNTVSNQLYKRNSKVAYYSMTFILDEWKVHSYTIIPCLITWDDALKSPKRCMEDVQLLWGNKY